ncbi:hypothetical protein GEMRC1_007477 [Eukaryota sp. GEM-RC1]
MDKLHFSTEKHELKKDQKHRREAIEDLEKAEDVLIGAEEKATNQRLTGLEYAEKKEFSAERKEEKGVKKAEKYLDKAQSAAAKLKD